MSKTRTLQLFACCVLGLSFAGCGGHSDDSDSTTAPTATTKSAPPASGTDAPQMSGGFNQRGGQSATKK